MKNNIISVIAFLILSCSFAFASQCFFSGDSYVCLPTIESGTINWPSLTNSEISTGGLNWTSVFSQEVNPAGVNWVDLTTEQLQTSTGVNWNTVTGL